MPVPGRITRVVRAAFAAVAILSCASPTESAPPVALEIVQPAAGAVSGAPFSIQPIIHVVDANGRRVRSGLHPVTMTVAGGGSGILGTTTIGSVDGIASFWDVGLTGTAGVTYSITFTAVGLEMALQSVIASPGAAAELVLITPGAGAANGAAFTTQPVVELRDAQGNRRLQDDATVVTATVTSGTLTGVVTATAVDGRASFASLGLNGLVGEHTLSFEVPPVETVAQQIDLGFGPPANLVVQREAQDGASGDPFTIQPRIGFRDVGGNPLPTVSGVVVSAAAGAGATVIGTAMASSVSGVATFEDLGITGTPGQLYQVAFSAAGISGVDQASRLSSADWGVSSAGGDAACAIASNAATHCWTSLAAATPPLLAGAPTFVAISVGGWRKCGLTAAGEAWCWGLPTPIPGGVQLSLVPTLVPGGHTFEQVVTTDYAACGLTPAGAALCWGENEYSELGDGTTTTSETPVAVLGGHVFEWLSAGGLHVCGLKSDGSAWCWGMNAAGQLGDGTTAAAVGPVAVGGGHEFAALEAGGGVSCGITTTGDALCWGLTLYAGVGGGGAITTPLPTPVSGGHAFASIFVGGSSTCALTAAGEAWCWGSNQWGELANGTTDHALVPTPSVDGRAFSNISVGNAFACGRLTSGAMLCWGLGYTKTFADPPGALLREPIVVVRP